jgi:hypothetical protein
MKTGDTKDCFDVFAWHDQGLVLCEAKRKSKDHITASQLKFIEGALACGLSLQSMVIVEWSEAAQ